ncbi:MAG: DNA polymerase III subunit beta [Candidatus Buchananbacteria bacterium RIFCSPHIGHO2_02_FULL_40_13]|uniref:Beta sliding clamp n=1 Tax=Candidatus Buchananbacteria bacterium RIFCSPLOWO2_01_FULL_39_33 TaxID=1797543 RepID=A0A1G1YI40_9BACT|nr:MAG: DNA polymerase III subunit beta [Candidatus Buchananbacteria bacterium RIFCSPHIGHO2_01_FULL_40_35]OGY49045.1 MAG: DNA polymerase III subunit beta [Candidatus Buchananbacteria bacterium RIFCSPHIGHO2_02_FULL_40_13]OGY51486.1 MAG: DNA polymerase III subunit beta [Candidatus Buchananbacteria bacterium RIFCSPLOWO2_01_FULL_39_33]
MKISCTQENLNQGLMVVSHIAYKNSNLPILSNILIKVEDKLLTLLTTNLEIGVTMQIRSKVEKKGEYSIDAKLFSDYVSFLPKERIDLELEDDNLKITCEKQKTKIKGQSAIEFPLIPKIEKNNPYIISAKEFKQAISEVIFAVSNSEARPEISGIFMGLSSTNIILTTTDSYRLAEKKIKLTDNKNNNEKKLIIPVKTLNEISRILGIFKDSVSLEEIENIELYITENQIMFTYNGLDLISRLIEGQYPDYTQIIPSTYKTKTKVNNKDLIKAVKTSSLFTKSGINDIKIELIPANKEIIVTSSSSQTGENISKIEAEIDGIENNIVLNYRYLLDGLQNISSNNVILEINDNNSPCVIKPDEINDYIYIIMPIKQ